MYDYEKIRSILKDLLKPKRYEHSLSVSFTSACLAMRWGADLEKAEIAGLVHDCAKGLKEEELIKKCQKLKILTEEHKKSPQVLHSLYGPVYAEKLFGIKDKEILESIRNHTLGRPGMGLLEKIVFTADYIELRRDKAPRLQEIRYLSFTDLDRAVFEINKDTVEYLESTGTQICSQTLETYQYYRSLILGDNPARKA